MSKHDWQEKFYKSSAWKKCRSAYICSVHGLCENCKKKGKHTPGYIVHHIKELNSQNVNNPDVALNFENLQYLCLECHNDIHLHKRAFIREGLYFDSSGMVRESDSPPKFYGSTTK